MRRTIYALNYIMIINSVQVDFLKIHSLSASSSFDSHGIFTVDRRGDPALRLPDDAERQTRHSHGGPWERGLPQSRSRSGIHGLLKRATSKRASEGCREL